MEPSANQIAARLTKLKVLIVDDEHTMRKVTRSLLQVVGVKNIHEAVNGQAGLDAIRALTPDLVILDWEMPTLNGPDFVRRVRAPDVFPLPDVPIIMLTAHGERSHVLEAVRLGVNEFLLKPVSSNALLGRLVSIFAMSRPMIRKGDYYGPEPRKLSSYKPECDSGWNQVRIAN